MFDFPRVRASNQPETTHAQISKAPSHRDESFRLKSRTFDRKGSREPQRENSDLKNDCDKTQDEHDR